MTAWNLANCSKMDTQLTLNLGTAASDVFTAADIRIQKTIEYNLRQLYPRAKIIGKFVGEVKCYI